jgi:ankyrin repeat protein
MPLLYGEGAKNAFSRLQEKLYKRAKKHQLDELSTVSQATFNSTKRLKTLRGQSSSVPSPHDSTFLDVEPLFHSEYSGHGIDDATKQSLIDQLYFTKIDERLTSLPAAQGATCRWFLTKPEYTFWHDVAQQPDHGGFLWIKGNPGTGKSTLMKLLFEEAKLNARGNSSQITLSFFFLARGTVEEKSTTGLYRSLLHQLFEKAVELRDSLEWMTVDGARVIQRNGWHEEALKQTLAHAVQKLGSRSLTIFVDALDECDKNHTAGMVCFFEELCDRAREARVRLQICFSSRHYPTVVIQKGVEVTLEDEIGHRKDIEHYIKSKLRLGKSKQAESLRCEILEKSSSIFLWVVLVLDILNSEYPDSSVSIKKIRGRLKEIPPKLTDLFEMILARDGENLERLQACLKWILFATRPLKPQELYFAIQLSLDKECSTCWDQEDVDLDQIKTFVRSSSKGLAEVTRNKASEVQFIHESVRDFLLGKYKGQWSGVSSNFVGHAQEMLRNCCLAQLKAPISQGVNIPDPLPHASQTAELQETIILKFPFLEYSVINVLRHANSAQQNAMEQGDFLADFPLQRWIFLNNALERYDIWRYKDSVSILYILAERNLADLIRIHPQRESCFDVEDERYGLPIFAGLATGSHEAVQTFLEVQAETVQEPLLHHLCKQYSAHRIKRSRFRRSFTFSGRKGVFSHIVEQCDEVIFTFLCVLGKLGVELKDGRYGRTPLSWAAEMGNKALVKLLLEKGAQLDAKGINGQTPLSWAAEKGHEALVKLLLEEGAELEAKSSNGQTPLSWAVANGHEAVVKLLLKEGAELEAESNNGQTPLSWAAENGHKVVVKVLLERGAELEAKGISSQTPLSLAVAKGQEAVVKLLLEEGADPEAKCSYGWTPLFLAANRGHEAIVKLLLEEGIELNSFSNNGQTPLLWAARWGHVAMVKLLLENGADPEAISSNGCTPLLWAERNGYEAVVKLLKSKTTIRTKPPRPGPGTSN